MNGFLLVAGPIAIHSVQEKPHAVAHLSDIDENGTGRGSADFPLACAGCDVRQVLCMKELMTTILPCKTFDLILNTDILQSHR